MRATVEEKKAMRRLGGGLVNFKVEVVNQTGDDAAGELGVVGEGGWAKRDA
ncbi:MAG: hypothetical protein R3A10_06455 [Caldilineaceae bacterium]